MTCAKVEDMSGDQGRREIGLRVREAVDARFAGDRTQAEVAQSVDMTPDKFCRSMNGDRAFSSAELARIAHVLDADLHFLITGEPDPLRAVFAARHDYIPERAEYHNEGREDDRETREGVLLAYRQAMRWLATSEVALPSTAKECREALGDGFVRDFADRVEERLGIDVVRIPGLTTDYSLTIAGQRAVLLKTEANWFRSNWSLAHELGHLCLGHHEVDATHADAAVESAANAFAAELLLPAQTMRAINWATISPADVAAFVWDAGVSTAVLRNRMRTLQLSVSTDVAQGLSQTTQRFLRQHPVAATTATVLDDSAHHFVTFSDPIGDRMQRTAERRVPARLMKALRDGVEAGHLNNGTMAWLLGVDPQTLELDVPDQEQELSADDLVDMLGL